MKTLLLICILWMNAHLTTGQDTVVVLIDPASSLNINGTTNVNKFLCTQREQIDRDTITVTFLQNGEEIELKNATLRLLVKDFDCGMKPMTRDFREILQADKHPRLELTVQKITRTMEKNGFMAEIVIHLAGQNSRYSIPVHVYEHPDSYVCAGSKEVKFHDFNLNPPVKFMGMVKVHEELDISFNLVIKKL